MAAFRRTLTVLAATAAVVVVAAVVGTGRATAARLDGTSRAVAHAPSSRHSNGTSSNWSGYAVTGGTYRTVTASWVQAAVTCSGTAYSSFWVGIDGDTSGTVEQTGTEADCRGTRPVYSSWYEMYPKYPVNYPDPVAPGDHLTSSVTTNGNGTFTLTLTNSTKGWTESVTKRLKRAQLASAEVIAEAPSSSSGVLPLANFGTAGFSATKVNGSTLTNSTAGIDAITMQSGSTVKAKPSGISNGAFSVTWKHS
ncbi:MAG TPA: G1 family glutamic endopeptidase [Jatrophihabitantaceae bacterium]